MTKSVRDDEGKERKGADSMSSSWKIDAQQGAAEQTQSGTLFPIDPHASLIDVYRSAQILLQEGLHESAKKLVHYLLIRDPQFLLAQELLEQIQEHELKNLLSSGKSQGPQRHRVSNHDVSIQDIVDSISLKKWVLEEDFCIWEDPHLSQLSTEVIDVVCQKNRPSIEFAISFFQMECYELALYVLKKIESQLDLMVFVEKEKDEMRQLIWILSIQAWVFLEKEQQALAMIQKSLYEDHTSIIFRRELLYWLGRVFELQKKPKHAMQVYESLLIQDPEYRDIQYRLTKIKKI